MKKSFQDPNILDVTFCKLDDYSFLENLKKIDESDTTSEQSLHIENIQTQSSQPVSGLQFRKKLCDLKDWDRVMSRTKLSYDSAQVDAIKQVRLCLEINI